ncbi:MAG: FAD-dependent oxidoreductase, partial [Fibrobacter sp.]|nr:FAD-dependent oxidoreductase [Fibrobacter sp.]
EGAGAVRVMPPCMEMGHAAGVAAAIAIKENSLVRDVDAKVIQKKMIQGGSFLG